MSGVLCPQGGNLPTLTGSATVTVGKYTPISAVTYWGLAFSNAGSVTPTTWGSSGMPFALLCWISSTSPPSAYYVFFSVSGYIANEGWTTINIGGTAFSRTSASYSYDASGNQTNWSWTTSSGGNPYGTTIGATKVVTWS